MSLLSRLSLVAAVALIPAAAHAQQPAPARDSAAPRAEVVQQADTMKAVDEPLVLAGFYEMNAGRGITVTFEEENLYGTPPNGEKRKLIHKYGTTFSVEGTQMTLSFTLDSNGLPTEMVMRQNGQQRVLKKAVK